MSSEVNGLMFATYMLEVSAVGLHRIKEFIEKPTEVVIRLGS